MKLRDQDIVALAELLTEYLESSGGWTELGSMGRAIGLSESSGSTIKEAAHSFIRHVAENYLEREVLDYLIKHDSNRDAYTSILNKHGLAIEKNGDEFVLAELSGKIFKEEENEIFSYLESHAPPKTMQYLQKAKEYFDSKNYCDTISNCRLALESLTNNGEFSQGVDELVKNDLILDGDKGRKNEGRLLRAIFGFNSTLGSHTGASKPDATFEQALLSMMITKSIIRFLLKKIEEANDRKIDLQEWCTVMF